MAGHYCLGDFDNMRALAAALEHLPLSLREHYMFSVSPTDAGDSSLLAALLCFATAYSIRCICFATLECKKLTSMTWHLV